MSEPNQPSNGYIRLISACGLVLGIVSLAGELVLSFQTRTDDRQEKSISLTEQEVKSLLEFKAATMSRLEAIDKEQIKSYSERKELIDNTVSRNEFTELRNSVGSTYSLGDKIKEMQNQLNQLSQQNRGGGQLLLRPSPAPQNFKPYGHPSLEREASF